MQRNLGRISNSPKPEGSTSPWAETELSGEMLKRNLTCFKETDFQENQINFSHMLKFLRIPGYNDIARLFHISPLSKYQGSVINISPLHL